MYELETFQEEMSRKLDDCLEAKIPAELAADFNCTVPYLPGPEDLPVCDPTARWHTIFLIKVLL